MNAAILIVDDDANLRKTLADILRVKGYDGLVAATGAGAIAMAGEKRPALALIDLMLPDMSGMDVMERIKADSPLTEAIILTGHASLDTAIEATRKGAFSYLLKPYQMDDLLLTIRHGVDRSQAQEEILRLASHPRLNPSPVIEISPGGNMTYFNPAAGTKFPDLATLGAAHPILAGLQDLFAVFSQGRQFEAFREVALGSATYELHIYYVRESQLIRIHILDISQRKFAEAQAQSRLEEVERVNAALTQTNHKLEQAQNQLLQSEKMASIGVLAAGMAHEINNPIGFVNSNLATLTEYVEDFLRVIEAFERVEQDRAGDPAWFGEVRELKESVDFSYERGDVFTLLEESREGIARVEKIVQDLKDFSRVSAHETWMASDLRQGLESTLTVIWNELKYKCEVTKEYGDVPPVECIIAQLNQVFMNLLVNAAQAMESHGTITIRTGRAPDGGEVWVEISDTGSGIPAANLDRIFEPFFTTKPVGKGTGLGLSVSHGIVQKHHGRIEVESEIGKGTTFRIWLPERQPK